MPATPTYQLFGLRLRSEITLSAPESTTEGFDVDIRWDEPRPVPADPPPGRRLAGLTGNGRAFHTAVEQSDGYLFRFHEVCDVGISRDLRRMVVSLHPGGEPDLVAILLAGNVVALLLTLVGTEVLHGSAVETDGEAVAFVGDSGAGKSTLAAEACAAGFRLVADDLLAVDVDEEVVRCRRGGSTLRLRPGVAALAQRLSDAGKPTCDGRTAVVVQPVPTDRPRLRAIVLPRVTAGLTGPRLDRLAAGDAFRALTPYHRLADLTDAVSVQRHFHACVDLAQRVPVLTLAVSPGDAARGAAAAIGAELTTGHVP